MINEEIKEEVPLLKVAEAKPKRPVLLMVLCILTFAGSGINFLTSVFVSIFYEPFMNIAQEIGKRFNLPGMEMLEEARPVFFVFSAAVYALSFSGALIMWRMNRAGFHIYTIAQILLILAPIFFFHLPGPSILDMILSGIFVILYGTNLKHMT